MASGERRYEPDGFIEVDPDGPLSSVGPEGVLPAICRPYAMADHRYMERPVRSPTSAELAFGCDVVVIVAAPSDSDQSNRQIAMETADLRAAGGKVIEVRPDAEPGAAFRADPMDGSRRRSVFEGGRRQGHDAATGVATSRG